MANLQTDKIYSVCMTFFKELLHLITLLFCCVNFTNAKHAGCVSSHSSHTICDIISLLQQKTFITLIILNKKTLQNLYV